MTEATFAWVNGCLAPADRPQLTVTDRGFQVGDGVFETIRVCGGSALELPLHLARLRASARAMAIPVPDDVDRRVPRAIAEVIRANSLDAPPARAAVRVTLSRGPVDSRALLPPGQVTPNLVVQAWRMDPPSPGLLDRGLHLVIAPVRRDPRSPLATVKTTSRAEFVYACLDAQRRGGDDAVFLTTDGALAEATSASLFLLGSTEIATPSLDCGILVGTTRDWIIRTGAARLGMTVREAHLAPEELFDASEVLLAASVAGILPVTMVEGRRIGDGRPGRRTMRLHEEREAALTRAGEARDPALWGVR
jgi:branched-chain amino acid aminotransferase